MQGSSIVAAPFGFGTVTNGFGGADSKKEIKYYTCYVQGMRAFLKNIYELRKRHKLIDSELERFDKDGYNKFSR